MKYSALIPVKSLATAKSRLAPSLSQHQREILVLDMLHHVLCVLQDSRLFEHVSVVSSDGRVLEQAHLWGARALSEEQRGHNPALHAAALRECAEGVSALLTISADLPLLSTQEIRCLFEQSKHHEIVLAPSRDGTGTNAILVRPPLVVPYVFGPNSLHNYIEAARQRHLSYTTYHSIGLASDIDTVDDLAETEVHKRSMKEIIFGY
ncbi:MAG TPA: 2-phospho-L-lactate guanylyltransferase [Ktedonobacteraceae bacterium]